MLDLRAPVNKWTLQPGGAQHAVHRQIGPMRLPAQTGNPPSPHNPIDADVCAREGGPGSHHDVEHGEPQ